MSAGLVQPFDKHEAHYVELHKYHVLTGQISALPSMLQPHQQRRLAIKGPPEEMPKPIAFPSFHPADPAQQQLLIQQSAAVRSDPSRALMSSSSTSTVATRAADLLHSDTRIEEVKDEEDLISYYNPPLIVTITYLY